MALSIKQTTKPNTTGTINPHSPIIVPLIISKSDRSPFQIIQIDILSKDKILASTKRIGNTIIYLLRQISQLCSSRYLIRIVFRSATSGKSRGHRTIPHVDIRYHVSFPVKRFPVFPVAYQDVSGRDIIFSHFYGQLVLVIAFQRDILSGSPSVLITVNGNIYRESTGRYSLRQQKTFIRGRGLLGPAASGSIINLVKLHLYRCYRCVIPCLVIDIEITFQVGTPYRQRCHRILFRTRQLVKLIIQRQFQTDLGHQVRKIHCNLSIIHSRQSLRGSHVQVITFLKIILITLVLYHLEFGFSEINR